MMIMCYASDVMEYGTRAREQSNARLNMTDVNSRIEL